MIALQPITKPSKVAAAYRSIANSYGSHCLHRDDPYDRHSLDFARRSKSSRPRTTWKYKKYAHRLSKEILSPLPAESTGERWVWAVIP